MARPPAVWKTAEGCRPSGPDVTHEAENLDAAIALAARFPQARLGGAVEIRPVEEYY